MIFDKSNDRIIAAGNAALIYIFEMFNSEPHAVLKGHTDSINCLAMDNYYLFSGISFKKASKIFFFKVLMI